MGLGRLIDSFEKNEKKEEKKEEKKARRKEKKGRRKGPGSNYISSGTSVKIKGTNPFKSLRETLPPIRRIAWRGV
jgi:hypothetical protein